MAVKVTFRLDATIAGAKRPRRPGQGGYRQVLGPSKVKRPQRGFKAEVRVLTREEFNKRFGRKRSVAKRLRKYRRVRFLTHPELPEGRGHIVCPRCLFYHNTVWLLTDVKRPIVPLHPHCYCSLEPELDEEDPLFTPELEPEPISKPGQHLGRVLRKVSKPEQERVLGKGMTRLLRSGAIKHKDIVSPTQGLRPLSYFLEKLDLSVLELLRTPLKQLAKLAKGVL